MTPLAARVLRGVRRSCLAGSTDRVLVALSGGPDSVALTLLLREVLPEVGAAVIAVAHLHHGLRGADADADEAFCRAFAARLGTTCIVERVDAAACAREHRLSIEAAGHRLRYQFYARASAAVGATLVATGHTRNDLAETFLMRALRGAGSRGLGGIRWQRGDVIRPLLEVSRPELLDYLASLGQDFREDASNRDRNILRNRIRHDLLPWLEEHVSPRAVESLARTAQLAAADHMFIESAARLVGATVKEEGTGVALDMAALKDVADAVLRRVVLGSIERASGHMATASAVERVVEVLRGLASPDDVLIEGLQVSMADGLLRLTAASRRRGPRVLQGPHPSGPPDVLSVPGRVALAGGGTMEASWSARGEGNSWEAGAGKRLERPGDVAVLDGTRIRQPLGVRYRRPGDRVRPLGMAGHKKIQDVFVDHKVPRSERDRVPLVVDADERILWVPGHVIAEDARVTPATTSVLLLQYRR